MYIMYIIMFSLAGECVQTSVPVFPPDCQPSSLSQELQQSNNVAGSELA